MRNGFEFFMRSSAITFFVTESSYVPFIARNEARIIERWCHADNLKIALCLFPGRIQS
jgi:hypothetical protein